MHYFKNVCFAGEGNFFLTLSAWKKNNSEALFHVRQYDHYLCRHAFFKILLHFYMIILLL